MTPEGPPPGEHQSNGRVEEAGKTMRGLAKVFKDAIEDKRTFLEDVVRAEIASR